MDWQAFAEQAPARTGGKLQDVAIVTHQGAVLGCPKGVRSASQEIAPLVDILVRSQPAGGDARFWIGGIHCSRVTVDLDQQVAVSYTNQSMFTARGRQDHHDPSHRPQHDRRRRRVRALLLSTIMSIIEGVAGRHRMGKVITESTVVDVAETERRQIRELMDDEQLARSRAGGVACQAEVKCSSSKPGATR